MTVHGSKLEISKRNVCPDSTQLHRFIDLDLPDDQMWIREHVENCEHCLRRLDLFTDNFSDEFYRSCDLSLPNPLFRIDQAYVDRVVRLLCDEFSIDSLSRKKLPIRFTRNQNPSGIGSLGSYLIRREIAEGATSTVFEAVDTRTNAAVAIKYIRRQEPGVLRRVQREIEIAKQIKHRNLLPILETGKNEDGSIYLVLPLIDGYTLSYWIASHKFATLRQSVDFVRQVAEGVAALHEQGVLHRDIKPANILIDDDNRAVLGDYGLASFLEIESSITEPDMIVGTPNYMSPEQVQNSHALDQRADVYSLGATLYEAITFSKLFSGPPSQVIRQVLDVEPRSPRVLNQDIPPELEAICCRAIAKSRIDRYPDVRAMISDLDRWLQGKPVVARLPGARQRIFAWLRREPWFAYSIFLTVLLLSCAAFFGFWNWKQTEARLAESRKSLQTLQSSFQSIDAIIAEAFRLPGSMSQRSVAHENMRSLLNRIDSNSKEWKKMRASLAIYESEYRLLKGDSSAALNAIEPIFALLENGELDFISDVSGTIWILRGEILERQGKFDLAVKDFDKASDCFSRLLIDNENDWLKRNKALSSALAFQSLLADGKFDEAKRRLDPAAEICEQLKNKIKSSEANLQPFDHLPPLIQHMYGKYYITIHDWERARESLTVAVELRSGIANKENSFVSFQRDLGLSKHLLALPQWKTGDFRSAIRSIDEAIEILEELCKQEPNAGEYEFRLAQALLDRARILGQDDEIGKASSSLDLARAQEILTRLISLDPLWHECRIALDSNFRKK